MKRLFDVVGAAIIGFVTLPLSAFTAMLVATKLGSPVIFTQERPGIAGDPFVLLKFRTMTDTVDDDGALLPNADRATPTGEMLRRWSLDELPELWNVVKGDMSLVGPRPLLIDYLPLYTDEQARRHEVRPGLTGLAQIAGRNDTTWDDRFRFDVWYVENHTVWVDLKILALTVGRVVSGAGVNTKDGETMPRFQGTEGENSRD